ncbi:hypothetical protein J416_01639 [Gracilibacillus halophilus YIM-C55.5]|uniref:Uncharacterized protein n=1 Tax=Gracilibacillus halophilus YIM-C55.5 TaxID=1308866 RepID=N4WCZ9_9BACI|nr:hypothetical protein [Gracilibacillus halophilus]ENH98158.1 hypothetical protein J416_01639 [Gracilibacillus halophilus YIM-C55.5]
MKTIIFDVDDTLYDQLQPFKNTVHQQIDSSFSDDDMIRLYKACRHYSDEVFEKHMSGEMTALELQTYRITKACNDFGIALTEEDAIQFQHTYLQELKQITLFSSLTEVLPTIVNNNWQVAFSLMGNMTISG